MFSESEVAQSHLTLCDPMDYTVHGILQARILSPGDLLDSGIEPVSLMSPVLVGGFYTTEPPGKPHIL